VSELAPIDTEEQRRALVWRNRQLVARRWPAGALDACVALEEEFPRWGVYWTRMDPAPGFRAVLRVSNLRGGELYEPTAGELRARLIVVDATLPAWTRSAAGGWDAR
jgi:hypothetical protein